MEESVCRVTLGNLTKEYKKGTTYSEIAREFQPDYEHQIVLAMVDGYHLRELRKTVEKDCEIHFLTTADPIGNIEEVCVSFSLKHSMIFPGMI